MGTATKKISVSEIKKAKYNELTQMCKSFGVKYTRQKKDELVKQLTKAASKGQSAKPKSKKTTDKAANKTGPKTLSKHVKSIVKSDVSKSEKVRKLLDAGITSPKQISELVDAHYSHVVSAKRAYAKKTKKRFAA